jgi:hypothetical protein
MPFDPARRGAVNNVTVVLTDKLTEIAGTVTDTRGTTLPGASVLIVPQDLPAGVSPTRFVRVLQANESGRFQVRAMPAGRYAALAVDGFDFSRQWDPDVQQQVRELGRAFSLREGETVTVSLSLADLK